MVLIVQSGLEDRGSFSTTCWTVIADAQISDEKRNRLLINDLMSRYWKPVFGYIKRKGCENELAKDLTQDFFHEVVLGRKLISQADKAKGKFRTFLLTALERFLIDHHRKQNSSKRKPECDILSLDNFELPDWLEDDKNLTAEVEFNRTWVAELVSKVLSDVEQECMETKKEIHWKVFTDKVLTSIMGRSKPQSLAVICEKYGVENEAKASNMINTVKRRLKKHLERQLKRMLTADNEIDTEISEMLESL